MPDIQPSLASLVVPVFPARSLRFKTFALVAVPRCTTQVKEMQSLLSQLKELPDAVIMPDGEGIETIQAILYALATRLAQVSDHPLSLNQGTLYPALVRLEQKGWIKGAWQKTENNRDAKFYSITKSGERELTRQTERWRRLAGLVDKLLLES